MALAWPTVPLQDPDLYPLDVASYILASGDSSRLVRRLKIDQPLAISVSSSSYTPGFVKGWFDVTAECKPENQATVRKIILEEVERLRTTPVTDAELAKTKRQVSAQHVFAQQTVQAQARMLASSYLSTGDPLFDFRYVEGIQQVTAEQVRQAAARYLCPQRLNTVLIEPLGSSKERLAATDTQPAESPVVRKQLPNGLTVLLKRHNVLPMVSVQAYVRAGSLSDTDQTAGLASLAAAVMEKGTEEYSGVQIAEHFDSIGGSFGTSSQRNTTFLQCTVLKEDLQESLDYVYQVLFEPTFPKAEFEKAKQLRLGRIAARKANPQSEIMDFWAAQLAADSPYSRTVLGTAESVQKLSVADCKRFHEEFLVPNNMVLAVFGDIDPQATLKELEEKFGQVRKAHSFQWPKFAANPPLSADEKRHLKHQKKDTAMVLLSFPTVDIYDESTRSALDVLGAVLTGGGGPGGRLHDELRGERLVYYVFGFQASGFAPGYYLIMAQTRPEAVDEVVSRIRANLKRIAQEGVPTEEIDKAKEKLITAHAMSNTTASDQAFQAALDELYGLGFDYDKGYDERISQVQVKNVVAVVKRYFKHALIVTSAPTSEKPAAKRKKKGSAKARKHD